MSNDLKVFENEEMVDSGYIYVIETEDNRVKIGRSLHPELRVQSIRTAVGLEIVRKFISERLELYGFVENFLHAQFETDRKLGEWFTVDFDSVVSYINTEPWKTDKYFKSIEENKLRPKATLDDFKKVLSYETSLQSSKYIYTEVEYLAKALLISHNIIKDKDLYITQLESELDEALVKVKFSDALLVEDVDLPIDTVAKFLGVGRNTFFEILRNEGILCKTGRTKNVANQPYIDRGYFTVTEKPVEINDVIILKFVTLVTPKGQDWLIRKFKYLEG